MVTETKKGGGKLARSEITTVRLDPKLKYLAELAARKHRRTLSSYIEWAVERSLREVNLYEGLNGKGGELAYSVADQAELLWDVDESERFVRLAISYPDLLTHEEQEMWKLLSDSALLAPAKRRDNDGSVVWNRSILEDTVFPEVRLKWPGFLRALAGGPADRLGWVQSVREGVESGRVYEGFSKRDMAPGKPAIANVEDDLPF